MDEYPCWSMRNGIGTLVAAPRLNSTDQVDCALIVSTIRKNTTSRHAFAKLDSLGISVRLKRKCNNQDVVFERSTIRMKKPMSMRYMPNDTHSAPGVCTQPDSMKSAPKKRRAALTTPIKAPPAMKPEANKVPSSPLDSLMALSFVRDVTYHCIKPPTNNGMFRSRR